MLNFWRGVYNNVWDLPSYVEERCEVRAVFSLLVSSCTRDPPKLELAHRAFESKNIVNVFRHFLSDCFFANWRLFAAESAISYVFLATFIGFKEQSKITYFIFSIIKKL